MSLYNIVGLSSMVAGQPEDVGQVVANFQAIQTVLNGGIDDVNIRATAAIQASKFAGYPNDPTKVLKGDGSWGTVVPARTVILTGTVSYTAPTGATSLDIQCQAAGGGGKGNNSTSASSNTISIGIGGGGGGWSTKIINTNIGTHTVAVGAGGAAGSSAGGNGGTGGQTTFADTATTVVCSATGGNGGTYLLPTGSAPSFMNSGGAGIQYVTAGGSAAAGDYGRTGGGGYGMRFAAGDGVSIGGDSVLAQYYFNAATSSTGNFQSGAAANYGGGGTGGVCTSTTAVAGATGGNGVIIVVSHVG